MVKTKSTFNQFINYNLKYQISFSFSFSFFVFFSSFFYFCIHMLWIENQLDGYRDNITWNVLMVMPLWNYLNFCLRLVS